MTKNKNKREKITWEDLKNTKDLSAFANLLNLKSASHLSYILYYMQGQGKAIKYKSFNIKKKNGGVRTINAPCSRLKNIQSKLTRLLEEITNLQEHTIAAHGFKKGYSIFTNAEVHKNKEYVLNFDIKDFFPSLNFGRVRGFFISKGVNDKVATIIAQIACYDNKDTGIHALPQGSPCSPIISNIMAHEFLDLPLMKIAQEHGCDYSRYADDITFSTNEEKFPYKIAFLNSKKKRFWMVSIFKKKRFWVLSPYIEKKINKRGFEINHDKTRMQYKSNQQIVTGLVVNEKVNVRRKYFKKARAMVHSLLKDGDFHIPGAISPVDIKDDEPPASSLLGKMNKLEGILNHIYHIKLQANIKRHYLLLHYQHMNKIFEHKNKDNRLNHIRKFIDNHIEIAREKADKEISKNCRAIKKLYECFLFYKYFSFPDDFYFPKDFPIPDDFNKAVIFCEGVSDKEHIKNALKKLSEEYPQFIQFFLLKNKKKSYIYSVKFPQFSQMAGLFFNCLNGGGVGDLKNIVEYYEDTSESLNSKYPKLSFNIPVIFITDNDEAAQNSFFVPMIKKKSHLEDVLTLENDEDDYFEIGENLYLIKLPIVGTDKNKKKENENTVVIEDLYGSNCKLKKEFLDKHKKIPDNNKVAFAKAVQKKIEDMDVADFSGFIPLLDRIDKTIKEHYKKQQKQT